MSFLSGFIAIIGPPNVGKSTLLNRIMGTKLAIVSSRPQTTRNRITGIYHGDGFQMVFMDTPGIHKTKSALHESMVESALATPQEVDLVLLVIEMQRPDDPEIPSVAVNLKKIKKPCMLVINKIDMFPKEQLLPFIDNLRQTHPFDAIIPVSALKGDGVGTLLEELKSRLKPGPRFFPEDMNTDRTEAFLVSEIIREKIYFHMRQELPYSSAVTVDKIEEIPDRNLLSIAARIHVETESQKGILIGQKGRMVKAIGRSARLELEKMFSMRVFLDLKVRVEKNWTKDPKALNRLGY
ncbi:MAG: GTPase Era [Deltaproteobacteria bacterium]|nr:GTPase Era [Deltaproteobacteria bacterium]MBW2345067.1 GTPase Era [Deltaproteobacteria bacterium]